MGVEVCELYKAEIDETEEGSEVKILINKDLPIGGKERSWPKGYQEMYKEEASKLYKMLANNLPGGTLDALLVKLLENKICLWRVAIGGADEN